MLEAIAFYFDASAQLYYNDGDLWGHTIVGSINVDGSFEGAQIAGWYKSLEPLP